MKVYRGSPQVGRFANRPYKEFHDWVTKTAMMV